MLRASTSQSLRESISLTPREAGTRSSGGNGGGRVVPTPRRSMADFSVNQTLGSAMKVFVRVRPFSERELSIPMSSHSTIRIDPENQSHISILDPQKDFRPKETFSFTRCFWSVLEYKEGNRNAEDISNAVNTFVDSNSPIAQTPDRRRNRLGRQSAVSMSMSSLPSRGVRASMAGLDVAQSTSELSKYLGAGSASAIVDSDVQHPPYASQDEIYKEVGRPVLLNALDGYNGCVFAYGQTGSGKTFTMLGYAPKTSDLKRNRRANGDDDDDDLHQPSMKSRARRNSVASERSGAISPEPWSTSPLSPDPSAVDIVDSSALDPNELQGIIPRIASDLFIGLREKREKDPTHSYRVEVEYYEIYNEKVYDLIKPQKDADLKIRQNPVTGPFVEGLASKIVANEEQVARIIRKGSIERHTAATKMNNRSSRSHAILTFNILQLYLDETDASRKMQGKLNLVDLAGSERTGASGVEGKHFKEATKINLSLTTLGRVIDCLADLSLNKSLAVPVPYRDSNLTWLLMDSLGGNSKTSMIATISPHLINYEEMRQTIRYASRAKQIVNKAVVNEDPQIRQIKYLTSEVDRLSKIIRDHGYNEYSREYVLELQRRNAYLEKRCEEQEKTIVELRAELDGKPSGAFRNRGSMMPSRSGAAIMSHGDANDDDDNVLVDDDVITLEDQLAKACNQVKALRKAINGKDGAISNGSTPSASVGDDTALLEQLAVAHGLSQDWDRLQRELRSLREDKLRNERSLALPLFIMDITVDSIFDCVRTKERELFRAIDVVEFARNEEAAAATRKIYEQHKKEIATLHSEHQAELKQISDTTAEGLRNATVKSTSHQQQLMDKHVEKLKFLEERLNSTKKVYQDEVARLEADMKQMKHSADEQMNRMRSQYQEELRRVRESVEAEVTDRTRAEEGHRRMIEHQKDVHRLEDEKDSIKRAKDREIQKLKTQLENLKLNNEGALLEKDRVARNLQENIVDLKRDMSKLKTERDKAESAHQLEMKNLMLEHQKLIEMSSKALREWESKSVEQEVSFCQLRALLHSEEYKDFRRRLNDLAFRKRTDFADVLNEVERRKIAESRQLREIVQSLKRNQEESKSSLERFATDVMREVSRVSTSVSASRGTFPPGFVERNESIRRERDDQRLAVSAAASDDVLIDDDVR